MGFSLKKTFGGAIKGAILGPAQAVTGANIGMFGDLKDAFGGAFKNKITPADPQAAELKDIKLDAARGEKFSFDKFRERLDEDPSQIIRGDITRESEAIKSAGEDAKTSLSDRIKQQGMQGSSIGQMTQANIDRQTAENILKNRSSFRKRLDEENVKRLGDFRNVAAGTLANQNVPIRFRDVKEDSFAKQLLKGAVQAGVQGTAKSFGSKLGAA